VKKGGKKKRRGSPKPTLLDANLTMGGKENAQHLSTRLGKEEGSVLTNRDANSEEEINYFWPSSTKKRKSSLVAALRQTKKE